MSASLSLSVTLYDNRVKLETTELFLLSFLKHLFLVLSSVFVSKQQILTLSR